jgi:mono/diheme cytochrome c family protein
MDGVMQATDPRPRATSTRSPRTGFAALGIGVGRGALVPGLFLALAFAANRTLGSDSKPLFAALASATAQEDVELAPFDSPAELAERFTTQVQPFLEAHCAICHSGSEPEAGFDIDGYTDVEAIVAGEVLWRHAAERVRRDQMPPADRERPDADSVERFIDFIERAARSAYDPARGVDPGRNVLRRLNNTEYANTVRDVLGVRFDAHAHFPADNIGHGFDNVADVQMLDELLLERYLEAAQLVAQDAIRWEQMGEPTVRPISPVEMEGGRARDSWRALWSNGETGAYLELPRAGRYRLRATAHADQAGDELARMELRRGGTILTSVEVVSASNGAPDEHEIEFEVDEGGEHWIGAAFVNDFADKANDQDRNLFVHGLEVIGPIDPPQPTAIQERLRALVAGERNDNKALEAQLAWLATRLWRTKPDSGDLKRIAKLVPKKAERDEALQICLSALLASPRFVFRLEDDEARDEDVRDLDGYELATRLSYFLWSAPPDDALLGHAADGTLLEHDVLVAELERMLADPRSGELARNFGSQWLQTRRLTKHDVDPAKFDTITPELLAAMQRETLLVFEAVMREKRSIRDLLDADFTFVNDALAEHYGMPRVDGSFLRRVSLVGTDRRGILLHGSILTANSEPNRTSPVKRGKWVLQAILGSPLPPPPPGADSFGADDPAQFTARTARERFAAHRSNAVCASCHDLLDPIGFGLERYDAVGRRRDRDGSGAIDSSGTLPTGESFANELEMIARIRDLDRDGRYFDGPSLVRSVVENLLVYALGRGLGPSDHPTVGHVLGRLDPDHPTLHDAIREIVLSDAFTKRRTRAAQ